MRCIINFLTFDTLNVGHLRILDRLRKLGDYLLVDVSPDA